MQPFDLRSKGSWKPVSWENGKLHITYNFPDAWHDIESHLIGRWVDMTSNWAPIVLCMNPFIHQASHYPAIRTPPLDIFTIDKPLLVVSSFHITAVPLILTLLPNPWHPKSPWSVMSDTYPSYLLFQTLLPLFWTLTCMIWMELTRTDVVFSRNKSSRNYLKIHGATYQN